MTASEQKTLFAHAHALASGTARLNDGAALTARSKAALADWLGDLEEWADGDRAQTPAEQAIEAKIVQALMSVGGWPPPAPAPEPAGGPIAAGKGKGPAKVAKAASGPPDASDLAIPAQLKALPRWLLHRDKKPHYADGQMRHGELDTPEDIARLVSYADARAALVKKKGFGLGFAIVKGDGIIGIDADKVLGNEHEPAATALLGNTYIERSPSGKGLHAFYIGEFSPERKQVKPFECYSEKRFFTVTGDRIATSMLDVADATPEDIARLATCFGTASVKTTGEAHLPVGLGSVISPVDESLLRDALTHINPCDRDTWIAVCGALAGSGEAGFRLFAEWAATAEHGYKGEADCREKFDELAKGPKSGYPAIFKMAQGLGWSMRRVEGTSKAGVIEGKTSFIAWANTVDMVRVEWLWRHRLARGMLHLLGGTPGTGKSTIAFALAAAISCGGKFPDGTAAPKGKVLIWSGEDSYNATIKPRLMAAGADMSNIGFLSQPRETTEGEKVDFNPAEHLSQLMREIEAMPRGTVAMLLIDPIVTMVGKGDNNSTSEVRSALAPLVAMLAVLDIVGLGIMHFTKGSENKDPKDRFNGSGGYIALARVGLAVVKDQNEPGRHLLTVAKSNIGPEGGGHNYHIEQVEVTDPKVGTIETSRIVWGEQLEGDARDLIREAETVQRDRPAVKVDQAKALLRELLGSGKPVLVSEIELAADGAGIGWRTMKTAKTALGVVSERSDPADNRSPYQWLIPMTDFDAVHN